MQQIHIERFTMLWRSQTASALCLATIGFLFRSTKSFSAGGRQLRTTRSFSTSPRQPRGTLPFFPLSAAIRNETETTATAVAVSGATNGLSAPEREECAGRSSLLSDVGLDETQFRHASRVPSIRSVTPHNIFCNRELSMSGVGAMGFDMDYTLAQYHPSFDLLAFEGAKEKLVQTKGYPEEVMDFEYDQSFWARGLIIDTQRGNFLKIDRHKYVRVAYHGFNEISSTTRKHLYSKAFNKVISFSEKHFVNVDTLFQWVDCDLFASLVNLKDEEIHDVLNFKTYEEIYRDVRECVDLCHRDGVIKDEVARNPEPFIVKDPWLVPMLKRYKKDGVKLFLLTNSYWEYTETVMNFLYYGKRVDDELQKENKWLELFDLVVVGSCKPAFMLDPYLNLFRVNPKDGSLKNTDGVYEINSVGGASNFLAEGKTFQGGNWLHLQKMLETRAGDEILYVGDHLYSDVLRSKRTLGWRSAFIVPELGEEMRVFNENIPKFRQIEALRRVRDELDIYADEVRSGMHMESEEEKQHLLREIAEEEKDIKGKLRTITESWHAAFHPVWGALFNAGYQDSRFAFYVQNYACLYTSQATNFGLVSSIRSFRTSVDVLPHDRLLLDEGSVSFVELNGLEDT